MVWDQVDPHKDSVHELEVSDDRADVLFFFFLNRIVLTAVWKTREGAAVMESRRTVSRQR